MPRSKCACGKWGPDRCECPKKNHTIKKSTPAVETTDKLLQIEKLKLQRLQLKKQINSEKHHHQQQERGKLDKGKGKGWWSSSKGGKGKEKGKRGTANLFGKSFERSGKCIVPQAQKDLFAEPLPDDGWTADQEYHCCLNNDGCN